MAWFNWLDEDEAEEERRKKLAPYRIPGGPDSPPTVNLPDRPIDFSGVKTSQKPSIFEESTVEIPSSIMGGEQKPSGPTPFKGMIPEDQSNFLREQNAKASELKTRAASILRSAQARSGNVATKPIVDKAVVEIESADINKTRRLAEIVKTTLATLEGSGDQLPFLGYDRPSTKAFEQLKRDNDEFNRTVHKSPVQPQPVAVDPAKLEAARSGYEKAIENAAVASTEEDRKFWNDRASDLQKTIKLYEQREMQMQAKAATLAGEQPTLEEKNAEEQKQKAGLDSAKRQAAFTGDDGTPGKDSIIDIFKPLSTGGRGREELAGMADKALKKIGDIIPDDLLSHAPFFMTLPIYAEALGLNVFNRVVSPLAKLEKGSERNDQGAIGEQRRQEGEMAEASNERKTKEAEQRQKVKELGDLHIMNTPLGAIGFILTSMVLGPKMAGFIFSRAAARGTLKVELMQLRDDIKALRDKEGMHFRMSQQAAMKAVDDSSAFGLAEKEQESRMEGLRESRYLDHIYRMHEMQAEFKSRRALQGDKADTMYDELEGAYKRKLQRLGVLEPKIVSQERKIAKLQEQLADPMTPKAAIAKLDQSINDETTILEQYEIERSQLEANLDAIDKYMRDHGKSAGLNTEGAGGK